MSVSVTTAKVQYTLSSGAQALPVPFYFIDDTHIKVVRARTGVVDLVLIKGTDYIITGAGDEAGGTVTTIAGTAAALAAADKITIKRDIPVTQLVNYVYNDKFPAEVHERALDKLTMIVQQLKEVTDRAVQFPETEVAGTGNIMPAASGRAAKILGFDASGNAVQLYDPVSAVFAEGDAIYANSVAALKAISVTDLLNGQQCHVGGYASVGDGGGGTWVYLSASSATEIVGTIIAPNAGSGRWFRVFSGAISALWFGAKGDNLTDDTTAVQAALSAGYGEVHFPAGTYIVENVTFPSNVRITGAAGGTTLKLKSGASTDIILNSTSTKSNVAIRDIAFDLNGEANGICVNLVAGVDIVIDGCSFSGNYGIYLMTTSNGLRVSNCKFTGNYGIVTENSSTTSNVSVTGCLFKALTGDGVAVNCPTGTARNYAITGNVFDTIGNNAAAGFGVSLSGNYIDGVTISGNTFYRCDHQAVHIEDGTRNVSVVGNIMRDIGYGSAQTFRAGVYIAATVAGREISNITVANNDIQGVTSMQYGVYCGGSVITEAVRINGNSVSYATTNGLFFGSVFRGLIVSNNTVWNGTGVGIRANGTNAQFIGNVCFDTQSPKTQTYGISYNGATDILYAFNNLKDNLTGAFTSASGDTRAHFIGNIESAAVDNVIKSASKSHIAATDTEIGLALPIAENTSEAIAISGTVNNRAVGVNHVLNVTSAGSTPQLTGLVARAGTRVFVKNNSGVSFNIMHQSASSTDVNRIIMKAGADLTMTSGQMRGFYYFGNRWHEV